MRLYFLITLVFLFAACNGTANNLNGNSNVTNKSNTTVKANTAIPVYTYEIVNTFKHDPKAFTEGLFFHDGFLYESTGEEGKSSLRKVELETGKVVQKFDLPKESFGEGISLFNDKIYQLTWQEGVCRVFDAKDFKLLKEVNYEGQGWGMTTDGKNLIMSNGMHIIKFIDPETFKTVRTLTVLQPDGKPLFLLNELEYIKGEIWANIWHSEDPSTGVAGQGQMPNISKPNYIVRIDPNSGNVLGWIDLANISPDDFNMDDEDKSENTLNGIAYDEATDRIFVTGKNWKKLFEIKIKPKQ
ncbi:MAG TPA: glutaminyl-peptide cyclotransferase [Pyrinomonadaceae bacterium]|jgi:glutamine cyclotransferase